MTDDDRRLADAYKVAQRTAEKMRGGRLGRRCRRLQKRDERGQLDAIGRAQLTAYVRELDWRRDEWEPVLS